MFNTMMNSFILRLEAAGAYCHFYVDHDKPMVEIITPDGRSMAVMNRWFFDEFCRPRMQYNKKIKKKIMGLAFSMSRQMCKEKQNLKSLTHNENTHLAEQNQALLAQFTEHQKRIDAEREQLRQMGKKMDGEPNPVRHNCIEARLPSDLGFPSKDWFLRIQGDSNHVDIPLAPYKDYIADCLGDACRAVPHFHAVLHRPGMEPVVVFTHG